MTITTPSGYEVHLKDYLAFGEKRQLEKLIASKIKVSTDVNQKVDIAPVEGSINYEMQDMAFAFLVQKIVKDGEELTTKLYDEVMTWKEEDGTVVYEAIDKITAKPVANSKKN